MPISLAGYLLLITASSVGTGSHSGGRVESIADFVFDFYQRGTLSKELNPSFLKLNCVFVMPKI